MEAREERARMDDAEIDQPLPLSPALGRWQLVRLLVENRVEIERGAPDRVGQPRYEVTVKQAG